jgi:hypothetical protein
MRQPVFRAFLFFFLYMLPSAKSHAQRYLSDYDSTLFIIDTLRTVVKRFENLHIGAYIQPQYQVAQSKGAASFAGGNFQENSDNRFMLRRARVKIDYRLPGRDGTFPAALFTFQFEATERDVNVRDMFVRLYEPRHHAFSLTAGLFARPFGYEVNLSSSFRESPERGRMSQTLMPSERDLGAMASYEQQHPKRKGAPLKFDVGVFNGQGKSGPAEFDSYKDLISRLTLKPFEVSSHLSVSGGLSFLSGGWAQGTKYKYEMKEQNGAPVFAVDSSLANVGARALRRYYGADLQLAYTHGWGKTELRGEYWRGKQPGSLSATNNPGILPEGPTYLREFDGAFFYFLQNIINKKWELVVKYDWYDPNRKVKKESIGRAGANLGAGDVRFNTLGVGMAHYFTNTLKLLVYYDAVRNERTLLTGYREDVKDNVLTCRIQMRF